MFFVSVRAKRLTLRQPSKPRGAVGLEEKSGGPMLGNVFDSHSFASLVAASRIIAGCECSKSPAERRDIDMNVNGSGESIWPVMRLSDALAVMAVRLLESSIEA